MKRSLSSLIAVVGVLASGVAFADCLEGFRKETPAEAAYFQKVQAALKEVLPAAPAGWTFTPMGDGKLGGLCGETPVGSFPITVGAKYTNRPSTEEADRMNAESGKIQGEINALEKLPPELTRAKNDLMAKYSEKTRAARQADQEGNKELARRFYAERGDINTQANEVRNKHLASVKPKTDELRKRQQALYSGPQEIMVRVSANEQYPGRISPEEESEMAVGVLPGPRPGLKVHGVRAVVKGPAPQREKIMSLVDKAKMERLLQ